LPDRRRPEPPERTLARLARRLPADRALELAARAVSAPPAHPSAHRAPPPSPLTALRLTVVPDAVTPGPTGDNGAASYFAVLTVTVTNPTSQPLTFTSGQLSTFAPAFSNVDTQTVPPAPSLVPLPPGYATLAYLDSHWGTLSITVPAHGTVSGTITDQLSHAHGPHTL